MIPRHKICNIRFSFILLLLVGLNQPLRPQISPAGFSSVIRSRITYTRTTADLEDPNYRILYELARDRQIDISLVRLNISVEADVEIQHDPGSDLKLSVSLQSFHPTGNTSVYGFDLAAFLLPEYGTLYISVNSKRDLNQCLYRNGQPVVFYNRNAQLQASVPVYNPDTDTLILKMENMRYDNSSADRFVTYAQKIGDYFASTSLLDSIMLRSAKYRTDSLVISPESYIDILILNKTERLIAEDSFSDSIVRFAGDPAQLRLRQKDAARVAKSLAYTFLQEMGRFHVDGNSKDLSRYANYFVDQICWFVEESVGMEPSGSRITRRFLDNFFILKGFPDDSSMFMHFAELLYPNKSPEASALVLSFEVYYAYMNKAEHYITSDDFAEAVLLLKHAGLYVASNPWMTEKPDIGSALTRAYKGIYDSYLAIARAGIENHRLMMAAIYLEKARRFRHETGVELPADTLFDSLAGSLSALSYNVPSSPVPDTNVVVASVEATPADTSVVSYEAPGSAFDRKCAALQLEAEILMIRAERNISTKRYIPGVNQLLALREIEDTSGACLIRIPGARDTLEKYMPARDFLEGRHTMENNIAIGSYDQAVQQSFELNEAFERKRLSEYGLEPVSLTAVILDRLNQPLCITAVKNYLERNNCPEALQYIRLFQQIGGASADIAELQQQTAKCLAREDYQKQNGGFYVEAFRKYALEGSWFRTFRSAYQKTWSDLENKENSIQPFLPE